MGKLTDIESIEILTNVPETEVINLYGKRCRYRRKVKYTIK